MSYQVLARKWRPRTFAELVGQEHVVTALTNALTRGRLHHAYLLTGTRGVGKTTIARMLAKSLNCITNGVTATPCGTCAACADIDGGRFVDLLELDAASNTGIDNMREILDNARYAPTVGRYKVYLIDEVHMLSKAAFNSMLKTLEEPPEHVKFVLATTDPQKIPVTVLSRCLQFNLKQLPPALIAERLTASSRRRRSRPTRRRSRSSRARRTARCATRCRCSTRRSPTATAKCAKPSCARCWARSTPSTSTGSSMRWSASDGPALLAEVDAMAARSIAFASALEELASLFHRIAVAQAVPAARARWTTASASRRSQSRLSPETVQLAYQICVQGRADLPLAPDEATGFSMTLLRLLAFEPGGRRAARAGDGQPHAQSLAPAAVAANSPAPGAAIAAVVRAPRPTERAGDRARDRAERRRVCRRIPPRGPRSSRPYLAPMAAQLAAQTELKSLDGQRR